MRTIAPWMVGVAWPARAPSSAMPTNLFASTGAINKSASLILILTLVCLYIEVLRLLMKVRSR